MLPSSPEANAAKIPAPIIARRPRPNPFMAARDDVYSRVAGLVGYAELLGVRFPFHPYKAALPAVAPSGLVARDAHGRAVAAGLTRGAAIDAADITWLKAQGYNGVLSLLAEGDDSEVNLARAANMSAERVHIIDNHVPSLEQVKQALDFICAHKPVYAHCRQGVGRTGVIVAAYRIAVEGCTVQQALAETAQYGALIPCQRDFLIALPGYLARGELPGYQLHGNAAREYEANRIRSK